MANNLGNYDVDFFAREALMVLRHAVGLSARVHTGYDKEYGTARQGSTIKIRRPATFTAGNAPTATAQDILTDSVSITLSQWKDVVFGLTDKELALSRKELVDEHIYPAMLPLIEGIETYIQSFYYKVPWAFTENATAANRAQDVTEMKRLMRLAKCPVSDRARIHCMLTTTHEKELLDTSNFAQWTGGGQTAIPTIQTGELGARLGFQFFAESLETSHTSSAMTDLDGAVNNAAGYAKGATTMAVDGLAGVEVIKKGDTFYISQAGAPSQRYASTADVTLAAGAGSVTFTPGLAAAVADNDTIHIVNGVTATKKPSGNFSLGFHRNWFGLGFGRLEEPVNAVSRSVQDEVTGLSVRVTQWYEGKEAKNYLRVDTLYGGEVLDGNLAVRWHEGET